MICPKQTKMKNTGEIELVLYDDLSNSELAPSVCQQVFSVKQDDVR